MPGSWQRWRKKVCQPWSSPQAQLSRLDIHNPQYFYVLRSWRTAICSTEPSSFNLLHSVRVQRCLGKARNDYVQYVIPSATKDLRFNTLHWVILTNPIPRGSLRAPHVNWHIQLTWHVENMVLLSTKTYTIT